MAGAAKKWAIGCGIGCGLPIIVMVVVGGFTASFFKDFGSATEDRKELQVELQNAYGDSDDFVPSADGGLAPERLEIFLAIRQDLAEAGAELSGYLTKLDSQDPWLTKAMSGLKMVPALVSYGKQRVEILLANGMGLGEYQYIYCLAYYNVLAIDPNDGPSFLLDESDFDRDDEGPYTGTAVEVLRFINDAQRDWLSEQINAYKNSLATVAEWQDDEWGAQLMAEEMAMREDRERLLWSDGLPAVTAASFEPFRSRLQGTHNPMLNLTEIGLSDID